MIGILRARLAAASASGLRAACLIAVLGAGTGPAFAQFGFFGQSEGASQEAYATIAANGFRLAGPMMQNGGVYIADVFDHRQRRQRLILSRRDGRIMQRFMVDVGRRGFEAEAVPDDRYGPPRRPMARNEDSDFMSRIMRGWGDDAPPRPPADIDTGAVPPRDLPRPLRAARPRSSDIEPQLATRRDDAPIAAKPLPAPPVTPATPAAAPVATASVPMATTPVAAAPSAEKPIAVPSAPVRATVVNTDPLRIPGERPLAATPTVSTAAAKPVAPPPLKPASKDVPVAPLE